MTLFSTLKANAMTIIKSAAENYPQQAVAFLKERLPALVARFGACKGVTAQDEAYRYVRARPCLHPSSFCSLLTVLYMLTTRPFPRTHTVGAGNARAW